MIYIYLLAGFCCLIIGAKLLVHSSSKLSSLLGLSPLIIGLTIVAYGTNSPELFVSIQAALMSNGEMAIGNVVGSNIFNILGVLGISALIHPLRVCETLFRFDVPIMILLSLLFLLICSYGVITPWMGIGLILLVILYTVLTVKRSKKSPETLKKEFAQEYGSSPNGSKILLWEFLLIFVGLILLIFGSEWFVLGASGIARLLGVSDVIIGLTLVAIGSSLPELATSIFAVIKKEYDIAVGNMIGSNIFNILGVMGIASLFDKNGIRVDPLLLFVDIPLMLIASALCVPLIRKGAAFGRWKGGFLLVVYCGYLIFTVVNPTRNFNSPIVLIFSCVFALLSLTILKMRQKID